MSEFPRRLARISPRLLAFNLLLVFLPVAGLLYLPTYESGLLELQERAMVQQGRLVAAALADQGELGEPEARALLERLRRRTEARIRVLDPDGRILADTSLFGPRASLEDGAARESAVRSRPLYRLGAALARWVPGALSRPVPDKGGGDFYSSSGLLEGIEVRAALEGRYGAATRISPGGQRSVTLYSAIPVRDETRVVGAVLVSQSTFRILESLYEVRLAVFRVFVVSVAVAVLLSLLVSTTIARPIRRLARQARELVDRRGRLRGRFQGSRRWDEIGDLARALEELTQQLGAHLEFIESYAADVSHEFKNPLASIRSATELLADADSPAERARFLELVERNVARMEHLLSEVGEIASIDVRLDSENRRRVDLGALVGQVVEGARLRLDHRLEIRYRAPAGRTPVRASPERLAQVVENLLDNAAGFAPVGSSVEVTLETGTREHRLSVADRGPGIPPTHLDRVFDRFFSYRPSDPERDDRHTGLGLAIVRSVVEGYGGRVRPANRPGGGALFEIVLPSSDSGADGLRSDPDQPLEA